MEEYVRLSLNHYDEFKNIEKRYNKLMDCLIFNYKYYDENGKEVKPYMFMPQYDKKETTLAVDLDLLEKFFDENFAQTTFKRKGIE